MTEENLFEQLDQIYKQQPVFAGNIIHKQAKEELMKRKWVMYYCDGELSGYVLTELGLKIHGAMLLVKQSAIETKKTK